MSVNSSLNEYIYFCKKMNKIYDSTNFSEYTQAERNEYIKNFLVSYCYECEDIKRDEGFIIDKPNKFNDDLYSYMLFYIMFILNDAIITTEGPFITARTEAENKLDSYLRENNYFKNN